MSLRGRLDRLDRRLGESRDGPEWVWVTEPRIKLPGGGGFVPYKIPAGGPRIEPRRRRDRPEAGGPGT